MKMRKKRQNAWIFLVWALNGIVAVCLFAVTAFYLTNRSASAIAPVATPSPVSNVNADAAPTQHILPTLTPNPFYTPFVFESATPFHLQNGPSSIIIGYSLMGRPIEAYTFGDGEREYLVVAGIHGGYEWNTIELADELIIYFNDHPEAIPNRAKLHIIRNMNPDGEARIHGVDGRVNNNGVDLNRNFPSDNWVAEWDRDGCWIYRPTTGGLYGGSEPETQTIMKFIEARSIAALISYHSAALGVFPGGAPWTRESKKLAALLAKETRYSYPPIDTGCEYTGTLADWAVENGVGAAVDVELRDHKNTDFTANLKAVQALLNFTP